jgi:hypothetical protein
MRAVHARIVTLIRLRRRPGSIDSILASSEISIVRRFEHQLAGAP